MIVLSDLDSFVRKVLFPRYLSELPNTTFTGFMPCKDNAKYFGILDTTVGRTRHVVRIETEIDAYRSKQALLFDIERSFMLGCKQLLSMIPEFSKDSTYIASPLIQEPKERTRKIILEES